VTDNEDPDLEAVEPLPPPSPTAATELAAFGPPHTSLRAFVAALAAIALVVGFGVATLVLNARDRGSGGTAVGTSPSTTPAGSGSSGSTTTPTTGPTDPDADVLGGLILQEREVPAADTVVLRPYGSQIAPNPGEPAYAGTTLDLCNGTFPSESMRTARRQVDLVDDQGNLLVSTEAVLYRDAGGGAQAMAELQSVASHCPTTPVVSPVGEETVTTKFSAPPDRAWSRTPTVERLAYDFVSVSPASKDQTRSIAVYLRRGRVLMGIYFADPGGTQPSVAGHSTVEGIVGVFEARIAALPPRVAGG